MIEPVAISTFPNIAAATMIDSYAEAEEILVSTEFEAGTFEDVSAPLLGNSLPVSNGRSHGVRRRLIGPLFGKAAVTSYDQDRIGPSIRQALHDYSQRRGEDGLVRVDLMRLVRMMILRTAAAIVGLDGIETSETAESLLDHVLRIQAGQTVRWSTNRTDRLTSTALEARDSFVSTFYSASLARRQALVDRLRSGELTYEELPRDLITVMLLNPEEWDEGMRLREVLVVLGGGLGTTGNGVAFAVQELSAWGQRHPEDLSRFDDFGFLRRASNEALRLRAPVPVLLRRSKSAVVLRSGREISAGEMVAVHVQRANLDAGIFGENAGEFNPFRPVPKRYPQYGLAFGGGHHLCIGKPLVTSAASATADVVERAMVPILRALFAAGVRPDPDRKPARAHTSQNSFETYPVVLGRL